MHNSNHLARFLGLVTCLVTVSCETGIDLYTTHYSSPVIIYGILDCSGKSQTVKIGRMIRPSNEDSLPSDPSSAIPADSMSVTVQEWSNGLYAAYTLKPADLPANEDNTTIFQGFFQPAPFMEYKLIVTDDKSGEIFTAKTQPLAEPLPIKPWIGDLSFTFGDSANPFEFKYSTVPRAMIYQLQLTICYVEITFNGDTLFQENAFAFNPVFVDDPPDYIATRINYGHDLSKTIPPAYLLDIFSRLIGPSNQVETRLLYRFNFTVWAGDQVLRNYIQMAAKFQDNRKQFFSNINGGYGLFASSSHTDISGIWPDDQFLSRLADDPITSRLKFKRYLYSGKFLYKKTSDSLYPGLSKSGNYEND